jgi:eukaryotic-like serine/threonine-protein kinase
MPDTVIAGRYRLDELLGRGGMSEVWSAHDQELGRTVAIKLLAPNADTLRFGREARAFASLAHPNVTQLYDYGEENGRPYMVLEHLPGGTLEDRLRSGKPLPDETTSHIAAGIAAGLAHAHARGVIHRDLKPANVLFDDEGRPKLADFGIARLAAGEGTLTEAGTVLGTAAYISPEQAMGEPASAASDVYSFGVILYRMLTGRLPFESADPMDLVVKHRDEPPPPITSLRRDAPGRLESTAMASLAKNPADRPRDGSALLAELGIAGAATAAATSVLPADDRTQVMPVAPGAAAARAAAAYEPPAEPPRRRRVAILIAALVLLAIAGAAVAYAVTRPSSSPPTDTATIPPVTLPKATSATTQTTTPTTAPTTAPTTTQQTTQATTTQETTRQQTTAPPPTTAPTTTALPPPPTTAPTTTALPPPTTDTTATTLTVP